MPLEAAAHPRRLKQSAQRQPHRTAGDGVQPRARDLKQLHRHALVLQRLHAREALQVPHLHEIADMLCCSQLGTRISRHSALHLVNWNGSACGICHITMLNPSFLRSTTVTI